MRCPGGGVMGGGTEDKGGGGAWLKTMWVLDPCPGCCIG